MGFWHTGLMDQLDMNPPGVLELSRTHERLPPEYPCSRCSNVFDSPEALRAHLYDGHSSPLPVLLFRGRECGQTPVSVTDPTDPEDWLVECDAALLNGQRIPSAELPLALACEESRTVNLELTRGNISATYKIDFKVAKSRDLDGVDQCLDELARTYRLDLRSIEGFVQSKASYPSAIRYIDGIAAYFYGVLARERSSDSRLSFEQYREYYDKAAAILGSFHRKPAEVISGLIAFHYNQFDRLGVKYSAPRLDWAARRFWACLDGRSPDLMPYAEGRDRGLDRVLSDAETERVLKWSCLSLHPSTRLDELAAIEQYTQTCEPLDAVKLRILVAEKRLQLGQLDEANRYAKDLRNNDTCGNWANSMLKRISERN